MNEEQHLNQCRRNYKVYRHLKDAYVEWACTVLFHTALHFVEAWLWANHAGWQGGDHKARDIALANLRSVPNEIYEAYNALKDASVTARYGVWHGLIDATRLAELHGEQYRQLCEHFGAPPQVVPADECGECDTPDPAITTE